MVQSRSIVGKWTTCKPERYRRTDQRTAAVCGTCATRPSPSKTHRFQPGELSQRTFTEYNRTTDTLIAHFERDRLFSDITPVDFQKLRSWYATGGDGKSRGLVAIGNFVRMARIAFKYAFDADRIDKPTRVKPDFTLSSRKVLDQSKADVLYL